MKTLSVNSTLIIRKAHSKDYDAVWEIFSRVIKTGDTYAFLPQTPKEQLAEILFSPEINTYVAEMDSMLVGVYCLKPNQPGLGNHIANGCYMVHPQVHGKGIGEKLGIHSLAEAKKLGYSAMQFNMVISTNKAAAHLWVKLGFNIVGEIPNAFRHKTEGLVSVYIMYKELD